MIRWSALARAAPAARPIAQRGAVAASLTAAATWLALLALAPEVFAQAGGGSSGFGGGGGGGGGSSGGGGSGGGEGGGFVGFVVVFLFVVVPMIFGAFAARRYRRRRAERAKEVSVASFEAGQEDPVFAAEQVRPAAAALYGAIQKAWDARDRAALGELMHADLMVEWVKRLDDFDSRGWHSRVTVVGSPVVEYMGLVNRAADEEDRVVVRITADLEAYVRTDAGREILRDGADSKQSTHSEYWTLGKRTGGWRLLSIEADEEGRHHLESALVATPEGDERLRDETVEEIAREDAAPAGTALGELVDADFADDARAAALDLSLVDGRFTPDVLAAAARRLAAAWAEAVDGGDEPLERVASPAAVQELLHPAGPDTRLVVRGLRMRGLRIVALDPPAMEVEVEFSGRRYVEDRATQALLSGSREDELSFTERWRMELAEPGMGKEATPDATAATWAIVARQPAAGQTR